jgi:hypothetical protein
MNIGLPEGRARDEHREGSQVIHKRDALLI